MKSNQADGPPPFNVRSELGLGLAYWDTGFVLLSLEWMQSRMSVLGIDRLDVDQVQRVARKYVTEAVKFSAPRNPSPSIHVGLDADERQFDITIDLSAGELNELKESTRRSLQLLQTAFDEFGDASLAQTIYQGIMTWSLSEAEELLWLDPLRELPRLLETGVPSIPFDARQLKLLEESLREIQQFESGVAYKAADSIFDLVTEWDREWILLAAPLIGDEPELAVCFDNLADASVLHRFWHTVESVIQPTELETLARSILRATGWDSPEVSPRVPPLAGRIFALPLFS